MAVDIYSNAFNFASHQDGGVDLRTGQYSRTIQLTTLRPQGPLEVARDIQLVFSMLSPTDAGYGAGWRLNISRYDIAQRLLTLASGEVHRVSGLPEVGQPLPMPDLKLRNVLVVRTGGEEISVLHIDGVTEVLRRAGDLYRTTSLIFENGEAFDLSYTGFGALSAIRSRVLDRDVLSLEYRSGSLLRSRALTQGGRLAEVVFTHSNGQLNAVTLPFETTDQGADPADQPKFLYRYLTLRNGMVGVVRVDNPHGGVDVVQYDEQALLYYRQAYLPAAVRLIRSPGAGQPDIVMRYRYSSDRNFTGYPFENGFDPGTDNLYRVVGPYDYWGEQTIVDPDDGDRPIERVTARFNRFHLMTRQETERSGARTIESFEYNEIAGKTFLDQPANLQLPRRVTTTFQADGDPASREETVTVESDVYGNTLARTDVSGIRTEYDYYPAAGDGEDCPADPAGHFVRFPRSERVVPASTARGEAPRVTTLTYAALPRLAGDGYFVLERARRTSTGISSEETRLIDPARPMAHGRPALGVVTVGGASCVTEFAYVVDGLDLDERRTVIGHDGARASARRVVCTLTNMPLRVEGDGDPATAFAYDVAGRVIQETVAPDTEKAARRGYVYHFGPGALLEETDAAGMRYVTRYDGLGRLVSAAQRLEGEDERRIKALGYDRLGRKVSETLYDQLEDRELALTTRYAYGGWNDLDRTIRPDGGVVLSVRDRVADTLTSGTEGLCLTVSRYNAFQKVDQVTRISSAGRRVLDLRRDYDGFGRCASAVDVDGHVTDYGYDAFDRITAIRMRPADGTAGRTVETRYDPASSDSLAIETAVNGVVLGRRAYDGLGRIIHSGLGEAPGTTYRYQGGERQPSEAVSARGIRLTYDYDPALGELNSVLSSGGEARSFRLDPVSGRVDRATNPLAERQAAYDTFQAMTSERLETGGRRWESRYLSSPAGRQLRRTGPEGAAVDLAYDDAGRLTGLGSESWEQAVGYDAWSRPRTITMAQVGLALETAIAFDDFGREARRTLSAAGETFEIIESLYDDRDRLTERRTLDGQGVTVSLERFAYDAYGRLIDFSCEEPAQPANRTGRPVAAQSFAYDALDNIVQVVTRFADGGVDTAVRLFDGPIPTQLITIESSDRSASRRLTYDADGNLLSDGAGGVYAYDDFGRLCHASRGGDYGYDAEGRLIAQTPAGAPTLHHVHAQDRPAVEVQGETTATLRDDGEAIRGAVVRGPDGLEESLYGLNATASVVAALGAGGPGRRLYLPYGESPLGADVAPDQLAARPTIGFNGQRLDPLTGLYHLGEGRRAYSPELMIFLSPDPLAVFGAGGLNPYAYCAGDPINMVDPSGLWSRQATNVLVSEIGLGIALLILFVAVVAAVPTGGASLSALAVLGVMGASAGVISSVLGLASAGIELADKWNGWDRKKTAARLNIASLSFGVLSVALGLVSAVGAGWTAGRELWKNELRYGLAPFVRHGFKVGFLNFMGIEIQGQVAVSAAKSIFGFANFGLGVYANVTGSMSLNDHLASKGGRVNQVEAGVSQGMRGAFEPVIQPPQDVVGGIRRLSADCRDLNRRLRGSVNQDLYEGA